MEGEQGDQTPLGNTNTSQQRENVQTASTEGQESCAGTQARSDSSGLASDNVEQQRDTDRPESTSEENCGVLLCQGCKSELRPTDNFCSKCGEKVQHKISRQLPTQVDLKSGDQKGNVVVSASEIKDAKQVVAQEVGAIQNLKAEESLQQQSSPIPAGEAKEGGKEEIEYVEITITESTATSGSLEKYGDNTKTVVGETAVNQPNPTIAKGGEDVMRDGELPSVIDRANGKSTDRIEGGEELQTNPNDHTNASQIESISTGAEGAKNLALATKTPESQEEIQSSTGNGIKPQQFGKEKRDKQTLKTQASLEQALEELSGAVSTNSQPNTKIQEITKDEGENDGDGNRQVDEEKKIASEEEMEVGDDTQNGEEEKSNDQNSDVERQQAIKEKATDEKEKTNVGEEKQKTDEAEAKGEKGETSDGKKKPKADKGKAKDEKKKSIADKGKQNTENKTGDVQRKKPSAGKKEQNVKKKSSTAEIKKKSAADDKKNVDEGKAQKMGDSSNSDEKIQDEIAQKGADVKQPVEDDEKDEYDEKSEEDEKKEKDENNDKDDEKNEEDEKSEDARSAASQSTSTQVKTLQKTQGNAAGQKTLLEQAKSHPLSDADGEQKKDGHPDGYFYRKEGIIDEKGQRNKSKQSEKKDNKAQSSEIQRNKEKVLTVVFHAILSEKFKKADRIVIMGEIPIFKGWGKESVEMKQVRKDETYILYGEMKIPLSFAHRKVPYKYVIRIDGEYEHEQLVEFSSYTGPIVNRCLAIPNDCAKENNIVHRHDGYVYQHPGLLGVRSYGLRPKDRKEYFRTFFPKWKGFLVHNFDSKMKLSKALVELESLVVGLSEVWISRYGQAERKDAPLSQLKLQEVILDLVMPKLTENVVVMSDTKSSNQTIVDAVISSVVMCYVFARYDVTLSAELREAILKCLKLPPNGGVCETVMETINQIEGEDLSDFAGILRRFFVEVSKSKVNMVHWLHALPLLHFIGGKSTPFQNVQCSKPTYTTWKWWGLEGFDVRAIQRSISDINSLLPEFKDVFDMDRLFKRSFLMLSPVTRFGKLVETGQFSCLELCVTLRKLLNERNVYSQEFVNNLSVFFTGVNQALLKARTEQLPAEESEMLVKVLLSLAACMKEQLQLQDVHVLCRLVECVITSIVLQTKATVHQDSSDANGSDQTEDANLIEEIPSKFLVQFKEVFGLVNVFLRFHSTGINRNKEIHAFSELLRVSAPKVFHSRWHEEFKNNFKQWINKVSSLDIMEVFCQTEEHVHPDIATILSDAAFKAVENIVREQPHGRSVERERVSNYLFRESGSNDRRIRLLSLMLEKAWPLKDVDEEDRNDALLNHVLTWHTWPGFFKFFGSRGNAKTILSEKANVIMARAESCIEMLIKSVHDGSVTISTLEHLKQHEDQFLRLGEIYEGNCLDSNASYKSIRASFKNRIVEKEEFRTVKTLLDCFCRMCESFETEGEEIVTLRRKLDEDVSQTAIKKLCGRTASGIVAVFFELDPKFLHIVKEIYAIRNSRIFNDLWRKYSKKLNETATLDVIASKVWSNTYEELTAIKEQFLTGEMKLKTVDGYLRMFKNKYEDLQKEFHLLSSYVNVATRLDFEQQLTTRIRQVKDYKKLFLAGEAAEAIIKLKVALDLKGVFKEVEDIAQIIAGELTSQPINSIEKNILEAGTLLEDITHPMAECLKAFRECSNLVNWLRQNIKDQQELKVFVDLAMISAGEDDMEIDRISCMHTSCLGFGSLIFHLKPSDGFRELMEHCKPVWQTVNANPTLAEKLRLTNRHLPWLKQIKESHGSVALTTLMQVEAINSSGVYYIAGRKVPKGSKHVSKHDDPCPENVVFLVVPADEKREEKVYTLEEIKDVQSKLMLIAGKAESGKDEVDQFVEVFEGVLRVSNLYLQLCEVGEIKYLTWKEKFQCTKVPDDRERLLETITEICENMENDWEKWKTEIDQKRTLCYPLNHFTFKQILKLRKELAKACTGQVAIDELPLQTFTLLETVNRFINPFLLAETVKSAIPDNSIFLTEKGFEDAQQYFTRNVEDELIVEENIESETQRIQPSTRIRKNSTETFNSAKETLEAMGYEEEYVVAALQYYGRDATEEELISWVVSGENDESVKTLSEKAKNNRELSDLLGDSLDLEDIDVGVYGEEKAIDERKIVQQKSIPKSEKPYVNNEKDTYLTLEALTAVLEELSTPDFRPIKRKLPANLKKGEPNLLLVPKGEVFGCVLSLYMGGKSQPLPTDEEVIVCDENTTAEEIELLWRRAVVDESGLMFCLANADLLDYDVSQQAVRSLEMLTQGKSKYHLVVICSIENEDKSNMVASLDQFRRQFPPITSMRGIQNYLKEKLSVSETEKIGDVPWQAAANVDSEGLSVRVVQSSRAGVGKSLIVKHLAKQLNELSNNKKLRQGLVTSLCRTIPVHGISVDGDHVTRALLSHAIKPDIPVSRIFHLDMSQSVAKGLDSFLFKLLILGTVKDSSGNVWRRRPSDMYIVEITTDKSFERLTADDASLHSHSQNTRKQLATSKYSFVKFLPRTHCLTPRETLENIQRKKRGDTEFDMGKFHSEEYQRTFQYLMRHDAGTDVPHVVFGDPADALKIIIKYCGIRDPSWAELQHFVNFLNVQLRDCEESVFCDAQLVGDLLQGFRPFAVRFMIQMSRDFATRSLSDNNLGVDEESSAREEEDDELAPFQIRRRWELSPHPYIFFNHDRHSMTFLGFLLSKNGDLLDPGSKRVLEQKLMNPTLREQLKVQGVDFDVNYEQRSRMDRIGDLCSVMGIEFLHDPDATYELTTDNVEKILAIHMRFRCGIPVIIMGETGCGKTRLIRFMCELQAGPDGPKNMLLMKVHGGTTYADIEEKVKTAEKLALCNEKINVDTILFFDEANTTDAIDLIKEIMVDRRVNGRAIDPRLTRLHFIAACNPYRKHTKEMIKKLESAGLGYHVTADETEDKLGSIPLRQLVYRVHPLPESMRPLVWDFGQLTHHIEELYTAQIVRRFIVSPTLGVVPTTECIYGSDAQASCIAKVLSASQKYMRDQKNECSFVSLRDVERAMKVITWFYTNTGLITRIVGEEDENADGDSSEDEREENDNVQLSQIVRAVILGVGVCYYAKLDKREPYCRRICTYFNNSCPLPGGAMRMQHEIVRCQRAFLKDIELGKNIARNTALSENVFMMTVCTELRIPLFVVGKPGSSKSLAKDVISTNMKAGSSQSELFQNLKQIHMQSYQCSPLSTPEGIVSTFRQCAKLQKDKDLKKFVSVVVLDEIGLAEDSPLMPLKTLHPLLEDGTATAEESGKVSDHQRVGFIGLSNWALDPAKMNRGIMLSRGVPSEYELRDSARGICSGDDHILHRLEPTIRKLSNGYFDLYAKQSKSKTLKEAQKDEFFGLRDFYSLVKMVYGFADTAEDGDEISDLELEQSIRRNFSGLDDLDPIKIFCREFPRLRDCLKYPSPECLPVNLIHESLRRTEKEGESRYLLILTENYAALRLLQREFLRGTDHDPVVIFGSSFPKDQHYTQICRNINRIKVCMETGRMVILLNLESLYESLYDALNQYYVYLDKQKYVDLGLGNHRVKCRVADKFKLIVVAEKDDVYKRFPIPLINRLEKHLLVMSTGLTQRQTALVKHLQDWIQQFSKAKSEYSSDESLFEPGDCFVGYHSDTAAAVIIKIFNSNLSDDEILAESRRTLLQCASPDAIARLPATELKYVADEIWTEYFKNQNHGSLKDYLVHCLAKRGETENNGSLVQITTHSRLLSQANSRDIATAAGFKGPQSRSISLQEFHTEQQFIKTIEDFCIQLGGAEGLLLVQCDNGEANFNLIACSRYLVDDTRRRTLEDIEAAVKPIHIVFIIQLPKIAGGCQHFVGFQGGKWQSIHIDELLESSEQLPQIEQLINRSVSDLFQPPNSARDDIVESMDIDEDLDASSPSGSSEPSVETNQALDEHERTNENIKPTFLMKNCLQAAAARIYDESAELDRATKRIEILIECFPEHHSRETELSDVFAIRMYNLLQQRDEKCLHQNQRLWLQHEALCQGHLQETGTFRKALWQKLSSIVSPMLSELIAYCDCNQNLSLLQEGKDWKIQLWLAMLHAEQVTPLSYDSFISPVSHTIRERACVRSTGAGHRFKASFPFSWIVKDIVNVLLLQARADPTSTVVSLRGAFYSSPLGILLRPIFEDADIKAEATINYLNDYIHMLYKPIVEDELQLIYDAVLSAAGRLHLALYENEQVDLDIPFIHFTYSLIQARLENFSELVHAFPELVGKILQLRLRLDVGEMILDVVALECCLLQLEPSREELKDGVNRMIWCNRVQSIRPIVEVMKSFIPRSSDQQEKKFDVENNAQLFGEQSARIFENCRTAWIRLDVVRMFIEHTCPPGKATHPADAENVFRLWKALGERPDFSSVKAMEVIERILKECSETVSKRYIKFDISHCEICKRLLEDPVQMPCEHICCMSCANGWFQNNRVCPHCRADVGDNFTIKISRKCRKAIETYNSFRNRCKSFFMELVSVYCFGEQLPDPDLVRKFIGYVIKDENKTEDFTPFDRQGIDVTPVVRSFILQQLLTIKGREKDVREHLEEYLRRANRLAEHAQREHLVEVCVLCIQCMEDVETVKLLKGKEANENVQITMASKILESSLRNPNFQRTPNTVDVNSLQDIARIRAALDVVSTYLNEDYASNVARFPDLSKCLESARHLCSNERRSALQFFLLKQLVRHDQNGIDSVKERCNREELKWILPPQSERQDQSPDVFIVHHDNYHTVREALGKAILTSNIGDLNSVIQNVQAQPSARSCHILLSLFREVTTSFSHNSGDRIPDRVLETLVQFIVGNQYLTNESKQLAENLVTNFANVNGQLLTVTVRQTANPRRLMDFLVHFRIVIECLPQDRLLQPLRNLAFNPALMMNSFIPTMPHDHSLEVMGGVIGTWYECPQGHRYVITECGRPNQSYYCPTCRAPIGGQNHQLAANNRGASRQDQTSTGHILGNAGTQQQTVTSERNLTPLASGVLRCLTHAAMLLGTDRNNQSIAVIIKPQVHNTVHFLLEHLQHDIRCIARSTGHNDDDAILIIHLVLAGIVNNLGQQRDYRNFDASLTSKESRTIWEDDFMATYLNPVLSNLTQLLQDSFGRMVRDERVGNNRLMKLLYELDSPNDDAVTELNPMCPAFWRYRKKITVECLSLKFQEYSQGCDEADKCEVLAEFLKKEHLLRALQYLPDILKLQRRLSEKFHRRLDRNEADKYTWGTFLKRVPEMKEQFIALRNSFRMAWRIVRSSLTQNGRLSISPEMCSMEVKNSTPISMFMPANSGQGRCSLALISFLVTLHNELLGRCKSLLKDESSSPDIPLANVTKAHLVAYDQDKDLLPMILAHCDYSLKVGEGTVVEFNWKCLERQLVDRWIRGRSRLTSLVELFVFSKDVCDGEVFTALKQKIPQEELTRPVQDQILSELNQLTDVCDILKSLHIAIGFLSSAGGDPSMPVQEYLHSGLKMAQRDGLKSGKAEQFCQLRHIVSLWLLLSLERARVLMKHKQDPFDDVTDKVKSPLSKKQKFDLNSGLQKLNVDYVVRELLEDILLYLKHVPQEQLHWPLSDYINAKLEEKGCDAIEELEECIPKDIMVEHAVEAWKVACQKSEDYHSRMVQ